MFINGIPKTGLNIMKSRERFEKTMEYGTIDRVPYFEEGIREDVIKAWRKQGLEADVNLNELFPTDIREEIILDLDPHPKPKYWLSPGNELERLIKNLNPDDRSRFPEDWGNRIKQWRNRDHVLMLRVHRGLFQSLGIDDWQRFEEVMFLFSDQPDFVREYMQIYCDFITKLVSRALQDVEVDAAVFSEPIGGNHGSLISATMYEEFALRNYMPIIKVLKERGVRWFIVRTYANAKVLIPVMLEYGINCLWACEVNIESMDYRDLRSDFGRDLRLIGGIDLDALRHEKADIKREVEKIVPTLVADGGYIPLADGRVREDVPFENYSYYRKLISQITQV
jgi:hypothetical protein